MSKIIEKASCAHCGKISKNPEKLAKEKNYCRLDRNPNECICAYEPKKEAK